MSEKGYELTDISWAKALLWLDIHILTRDESYKPELHYQATIKGKPLVDYKTDDELIALRDFLATKVIMEQADIEDE